MRLPRLIFLVAFLFMFIGLASSTTTSSNKGSDKTTSTKSPGPSEGPPPYEGWRGPDAYEEWKKGVEVDKEEEAAAAAVGSEDEMASLWRRFLLNECWVEAGKRTHALLELHYGPGFVHPLPPDYDVSPDRRHREWVIAQLDIPTPVGHIEIDTVNYGDVWDCECGGLRHWIRVDHEWWSKDKDHTGDPGALLGSWQVEDAHFRDTIADPAINWRNHTHAWQVFTHWRSLRRGYYSIPLKEPCLYPGFNESAGS